MTTLATARDLIRDLLFTGPAAIDRRLRTPLALIADAGLELRAALDADGWGDPLVGELYRAAARRDYDDRVATAMRKVST